MDRNQAIAVALMFSALGVAGCSKGDSDPIHATPSGVFYTPWSGGLFRVDGGKLVAVTRAPASSTAPRTLQFSEKIAGISASGFPVVVTGAVKYSDGQRRLKIELALGPLGNKQPSVADQAAFVSGLRNSSGKLKALTLSFMDSDGFLAVEDKLVPMDGGGWTGETGPGGAATQYLFLSTEAASPDEDRAVSSVQVKWSQPVDNNSSAVADAAAAAAEAAAADAAARSAQTPADPYDAAARSEAAATPVGQ
jgi:hypothetical protein